MPALFLLVFLSASCAGLNSFKNKKLWIEEKERILLHDIDLYEGNWQTRDLTIYYTLHRDGKYLQVSGVLGLSKYLTMGFSTLEFLQIDIYELDANGMVLDSNLIRILGYRYDLELFERASFKTQLDLDENTVAIAFGYKGRVSQGGAAPFGNRITGDKIDWDFWKIPSHEPLD